MTEYSGTVEPSHVLYEGDRTGSPESRIDLLHPRIPTELGSRAAIARKVLDAMGASPSAGVISEECGSTPGKYDNNPEGKQNAELFKHSYEAAVEAIDGALGADDENLSEKFADIINCLETLAGVPYISSAPEFAEMVKSARIAVEQIGGSPDESNVNPAITRTVLSWAKALISGTLVAYRP